jgi:hypothetical protein
MEAALRAVHGLEARATSIRRLRRRRARRPRHSGICPEIEMRPLSARKAGGERIDSTNIKKHKNDVFRLSVLLTDVMRISLPDSIKRDLGHFIEQMRGEAIDLKLLGIRTRSLPQVLDTLTRVYQL